MIGHAFSHVPIDKRGPLIEKAIARLTSDYDPDVTWSRNGRDIVVVMSPDLVSIASNVQPTDADLIVTLHRTIEPMLKLLENARRRLAADRNPNEYVALDALELAVSILGTVQR